MDSNFKSLFFCSYSFFIYPAYFISIEALSFSSNVKPDRSIKFSKNSIVISGLLINEYKSVLLSNLFIFNVSNIKGLSNLLIDDYKNKYSEYIKRTEVKNLFLLTSGTIPPNPSELLNSNRNKELVKLLQEKFDLVIFDGVPCNGLPDSIIMSTLVDKTIIVSAENITPKPLLENTKKSLEGVNANIAGDIVNKVDIKNHKYYGKYYTYYGDNK